MTRKIAVSAALLLCCGVEAQLLMAATPDPGRQTGISAGRGTLYPIATASVGYRTDVFELNAQRSSPIVNWRLGGGYQAENEGHPYGVEAIIDGREYLDDQVNNDTERASMVTAYWGTELATRHNVDVGIQYVDAYDPRGLDDPLRGSRRSDGAAIPDNWKQTTAGVTYGFGAEGARGRAELAACLTCREYDNNQQQFRNRDEFDVSPTVFFRFLPRTEAFVQYVHTEFDYDTQTALSATQGRDLDSTERRYMVGATWNVSSRTMGTVRVGQLDKEFKSGSGRPDYDRISWDAVVQWSPTSRDAINVGFWRAPRESYVYTQTDLLTDDYVEVRQLDLAWTRQLGTRMNAVVSGYSGSDQFSTTGRSDERSGYSVALNYNTPRFGSVGVRAFHRERDAGVGGEDYSDQGFELYFNIGAILGLGYSDSRAPAVCDLRALNGGFARY